MHTAIAVVRARLCTSCGPHSVGVPIWRVVPQVARDESELAVLHRGTSVRCAQSEFDASTESTAAAEQQSLHPVLSRESQLETDLRRNVTPHLAVRRDGARRDHTCSNDSSRCFSGRRHIGLSEARTLHYWLDHLQLTRSR